MPVLKARFRDAEAFLEAYDAQHPNGALFCATTQRFEGGEDVLVEINFAELPNKMILRGVIANWRPALPRLGVRAGAVVTFDATEADKRAFVLDIARGKRTEAFKRRHPRLPIQIAVKWRQNTSTEFKPGQLRNISIGGAQLVTDDAPSIDCDIVVELTAPGAAKPMRIAAKVSNQSPDAVGLSFIYRDGGGSRRLREVVRRLVNNDEI